MQTLSYGNNIVQLKQSKSKISKIKKSINNWLIISPQQIVLHGMLLTSNFNVQNAHQHLSIKFNIKSYLKGKQLPFLQIFPQKGNIMRGQIKKFRVKFARQFKPQTKYNNQMMLKIYVNLNTQYNKQYMITNKLRGWNQIKDLPIEEYQIPIIISDQYQDIKQNIRNSVLFQSQFGKVSQDVSSLYGDEKFEVPQIDMPSSKHNLVKSKQKPRYSEVRNYQVQKRSSNSQKKPSRSSIHQNSPKKQVYFGHGPKLVQSKLQMQPQSRHQRPGSAHKLYQRDSAILGINTPTKDKQNYQINDFRKIPIMRNPFRSSEGDLFKNFSDKKLPQRINAVPQPSGFSHNDSQISILKSLQGKSSQVNKYNIQNSRNNYQNTYQNHQKIQGQSIFKDYKTVDHNFTPNHDNIQYANKRSMQLIILAIIAGFFVALGSNIGSFFNQ